jgi:ferrochelatase
LRDPAVLFLAYGTPQTESEIEPYLTDVRRERPFSAEFLEDLKQRYRRIGGRSPLLQITKAQASAVEESLKLRGTEVKVYVGMKHWDPYIKEVLPEIKRNGHERLIALTLAPHYSQMSTGGYLRALEETLSAEEQLRLDFIDSWYDNPLFHQSVAEKVMKGLSNFPSDAIVEVIFTAHSLPARILEMNDPYPQQLHASSDAVAKLVGLGDWSFAYQSAGETGEK